jgi:hypothetical protein
VITPKPQKRLSFRPAFLLNRQFLFKSYSPRSFVFTAILAATILVAEAILDIGAAVRAMTLGAAAIRATIVLFEATLLPSGLVTMAFLLAMRLLIRDFFSIDIACSWWFFLIASYGFIYSNTRAKLAGRQSSLAISIDSHT